MNRPSDDPEKVERRLWYESRQYEASVKLAQRAHIPPWINDDDDKLNDTTNTDNDDSSSIRHYYEGCAQEKKIEDDSVLGLPLPEQIDQKKTDSQKMKMFTSYTLDIVDESRKNQEALSKPLEGRPLIIEDYWDSLPGFEPKKWLYPLNSSAKEALLSFRSIGQRQNQTTKRKGKRKVLICFHGLGTNHLYFNPWVKVLDALEHAEHGTERRDIELWSVCLPGRSGRFLEAQALSVHTTAGNIVIDLLSK